MMLRPFAGRAATVIVLCVLAMGSVSPAAEIRLHVPPSGSETSGRFVGRVGRPAPSASAIFVMPPAGES